MWVLVTVTGSRFPERATVRRRGTVFYADELQVLVKLEDGHSKSIRPGVDHFRVIES
jgi:hypothetical protein